MISRFIGARRIPISATPGALFVLVSSALLVTAPTAAAQEGAQEDQQDQQETERDDDSFAEEITVTSTKRDELLTEVPISVTVVDGESLERQRAEDLDDLVAVVPGLSVTSASPGTTRITLRGINTGGVASTGGVYVDDVPYGSSTGLANGAVLSGDFDTFDMARVEVLRGPQGTLYGASSLGGVLKYVPNRASTEGFAGRFRVSLEDVEGGGDGFHLTGALNLAVSDQFAVRLSGFTREDAGYIDSIGNNPIPSLTDPANPIFDGTLVIDGINEVQRTGGRLSALVQPSDRFSLHLVGQLQGIESDSPSTVDASPTTFRPLLDEPVQSRYHAQFSNTDYEVLSATLNWQLGDVSLESISSYSTLEQDSQTDTAIATALTGGPPLSALLTFLFGDPATNPLSAIFPNLVTTDKITQEVRLLSVDSDSFEWLLGAYYTDEESEIAQQLLTVAAGTDDPVAAIPPLAVVSLESTYEAVAVFGNASWHVTPRFALSFGARVSDNAQVASQISDGALVGGLTMFDEVRSSETPVTFSISPRYELGGASSIYGRVATGFRPGGPNVLPPGAPPDTPSTYDSDRLTSYEVGYKAISSRGRVSFDAAVYLLDWEDIQLLAVVNNFGINANGGTAESRGAEFTIGLRPVNGLTLSLNGAYTNAELTQDTDPVVGGMDGDPLSWVPELSFGLYGDYAWPISDEWIAHVGGMVAYVGDRPANFDDRTPGGQVVEFDAYTTVGVNGGVDFGRWSVELYAKNLTDEMGITSVGGTGFLPNGAISLGQIRPRTVGLSLGTRF